MINDLEYQVYFSTAAAAAAALTDPLTLVLFATSANNRDIAETASCTHPWHSQKERASTASHKKDHICLAYAHFSSIYFRGCFILLSDLPIPSLDPQAHLCRHRNPDHLLSRWTLWHCYYSLLRREKNQPSRLKGADLHQTLRQIPTPCVFEFECKCVVTLTIISQSKTPNYCQRTDDEISFFFVIVS